MIQPEILNRLRLLADAYRLPVTAVADRVNETPPVPGTPDVLAEVEARLPDGRFRVFAAGQRFNVLLPPSTAPGDRVRIALPAASAPVSPASSQTGDGAAPTGVADPKVSALGRFISQLAERADRTPDGRTPAAISASQPLLPDAPIDTRVAAATLRELIGLSGLFYESHQAEWVGGRREETLLRKEPQGRLVPSEPARPSAPVAGAGAAPADPVSARAAAADPASPAVRPEALPIVQQQIQTLEARHIVWTGQIWPGQPLRWEIEELGQRDPQAAGEPPRPWQTRIDLSTPRLGAMSALLTLSGGALSVRLRAESEATGAEFSAHLDELRLALEAAGLPVAALARDAHAGS